MHVVVAIHAMRRSAIEPLIFLLLRLDDIVEGGSKPWAI
jgi:hypothetical protein